MSSHPGAKSPRIEYEEEFAVIQESASKSRRVKPPQVPRAGPPPPPPGSRGPPPPPPPGVRAPSANSMQSLARGGTKTEQEEGQPSDSHNALDNIEIHSTISQDETLKKETIEAHLLALYAEKLAGSTDKVGMRSPMKINSRYLSGEYELRKSGARNGKVSKRSVNLSKEKEEHKRLAQAFEHKEVAMVVDPLSIPRPFSPPSPEWAESSKVVKVRTDHSSGRAESDISRRLSLSPTSSESCYEEPDLVTLMSSHQSRSDNLVDRRDKIANIIDHERLTQDSSFLEKLYEAIRPNRRAFYRTIHKVDCLSEQVETLYLEPPWITDPKTSEHSLRGDKTISNLDLYIERQKGLSFIVYRHYRCCDNADHDKNHDASDEQAEDDGMDGGEVLRQQPKATYESILILARDFCDALNSLISCLPLRSHCPKARRKSEIISPYLWIYHQRSSIKKQVQKQLPEHGSQIELLMAYVDTSFGDEYRQADDLISKGLITAQTLPYLFVPEDIVVSCKDQNGQSIQAYQLQNWPQPHDKRLEVTLYAMFWEFFGSFCQTRNTIVVKVPSRADKVKITDLKYHPIRFETSLEAELYVRGTKFWECRNRKFVCYNGWDHNHNKQFVDARFMIDIHTYKQMHSQSTFFEKSDDLGKDALRKDEPPDGPFRLLLPSNVYGYNLQEKKWSQLEVQNTSPINWDTKAFDYLVMDETSKLLIRALVTNKVSAEKATDVMSGKGNGLIVLLHGGPGTGKTLTAESVAELAEKPLYRVTCGDIGTNPEEVEKYLKVVLNLGKVWDCVVLLDEADVFLEQRTLTDLQRNALVSVFLRVLEYYDGILILTSNRVGTFDEAFKSRIQLSLHYEDLDEDQRFKIWENFLNRLEDFGTEDINFRGLRTNLRKLARHILNGRQIRNAITTARQLAMFEKKTLQFEDLEKVIGVASKFEKYLLKVNDGMSDARVAREDRVR